MLISNFSLTLGVKEVCHGQGMDFELARNRQPALIEAAQEALRIGLENIQPVAAAEEAEVLERKHDRLSLAGGRTIQGSFVSRYLGGAQRIMAAICSIGPEIEMLSTAHMRDNPLLAWALDGLGNAAVEQVAQQTCAYLAQQANSQGLQVSTPFSPGEQDWPLEVGQPQIFALVNAAQAGVHLTPGGMMIPKKSISFVIGIGTEMPQIALCEGCALKETCRYRHV